MTVSHLVSTPLSVDALLASVAAPSRGATACFLGTVRNGPEEQAAGGVTGIEYATYAAMAEAECARIVRETAHRWPAAAVALQHRVGFVPVGEASVAVAVAAPHRVDAFAACRHVIEEVKRRAPIWKRERHADGSATWVDPSGRPTATVPP